MSLAAADVVLVVNSDEEDGDRLAGEAAGCQLQAQPDPGSGGVRAGGMPPVKCKLLIANSHLSSVTVSVTASRCYAMNAMGH